MSARGNTAVGKEEILRAMAGNELVLHYQPIYNSLDEVVCLEALVRWRHPVLGLRMPSEWIPKVESLGLIHLLDEWVLRAACRQLRAWIDSRRFLGRVAVNVSLLHIQSADLAALVRRVLFETGVPPICLELELTETVLAADAERIARMLDELRRLGVGIYLDDFGTGFSSLSYLKLLPVDGVKIDRSFIRDVEHDQRDQAIVRALIDLAHTLRLQVVAEGVETEAQQRFLRKHRCDRYQGYLLGRPEPPEKSPIA